MSGRRHAGKNQYGVIPPGIELSPGLVGNNRLFEHATAMHLEAAGNMKEFACRGHCLAVHRAVEARIMRAGTALRPDRLVIWIWPATGSEAGRDA